MSKTSTKPIFDDIGWLHKGRFYTAVSHCEKIKVRLDFELLTLTDEKNTVYRLTPRDVHMIKFEPGAYQSGRMYAKLSTSSGIFRIMFTNPGYEALIFPSRTSMKSQFASTPDAESVFSDALMVAHFNVGREPEGVVGYVNNVFYAFLVCVLLIIAAAIISIIRTYR